MNHSIVITPELITMIRSIVKSNIINTLNPGMLNSPTLDDSINTILDQIMTIVMSFFGL